MPARLTGLAPRLNSSIKSFFRVAPELPPPPYTWLITTPLDRACADRAEIACWTRMASTTAAMVKVRRDKRASDCRGESGIGGVLVSCLWEVCGFESTSLVDRLPWVKRRKSNATHEP